CSRCASCSRRRRRPGASLPSCSPPWPAWRPAAGLPASSTTTPASTRPPSPPASPPTSPTSPSSPPWSCNGGGRRPVRRWRDLALRARTIVVGRTIRCPTAGTAVCCSRLSREKWPRGIGSAAYRYNLRTATPALKTVLPRNWFIPLHPRDHHGPRDSENDRAEEQANNAVGQCAADHAGHDDRHRRG